MNMPNIILWGFVATIVFTALMSASQGIGFSRMSIPLMLGSMFTPDTDRAKIGGFMVHMMVGWMFALIYGLAFESIGTATWWLGAGFGFIHVFFVLTAGMRLMPTMHPRMASERHGPTPTRQLQPPGIMAFNYGRRTPLVALVAHLAYGAILGGFYHLA